MIENNEGRLRTAPLDTSTSTHNCTTNSNNSQSIISISKYLLKKKLSPKEQILLANKDWNEEAQQAYKNGFHPIPKGTGKLCKAANYTPIDKVKPQKGEVEYTEEFMASQNFRHGYCIATDKVTCLDYDCLSRELAENMLDHLFGGLHGKFIVRIGTEPKFSIVVRSNETAPSSTRSFYDADGNKNQFEIIAGKAQHSAVAGSCNTDSGFYEITSDDNFTNTRKDELPFASNEMIQELKDYFEQTCIDMEMTTEEERVEPSPEAKEQGGRSIAGDMFEKVSRETSLQKGAEELEEHGWSIVDGMKTDGSYHTFDYQGRKVDCIHLCRPGMSPPT